MDKFKWAIIVLGAIFLIILADKWVFQPQEKEAKELECAQHIKSKIESLEDTRGLTPAMVEDWIDICIKGY